MKINISGLKCDTKGCDFRDDEVTFEEYPKNIGRPCPQCGASLLTQQDYDKCFKLYQKVEALNIIGDKLKKIFPWNWLWRKDSRSVAIKFNNDGSREIKIKNDRTT